jgi:hypothetical protein
MGMQRGEQPPRRLRDFRHRAIECRGVGLRRPGEAGEFAYELQRRCLDFVLGRRRFEIEQRLDVAAHLSSPSSERRPVRLGFPENPRTNGGRKNLHRRTILS